ncbi:MAG TPA: adenylate/guanylate cyclase domain-containing protein, partial [Phenylobacterium sp.]
MTQPGAGASDGHAAAPASPWRRFAFAIIVLSLLAGICLPFFVDLVARDAPEARAGVVDYSHWRPLTKPVELRGDWRVVWHTAPRPGTEMLLRVPGQWSGPHPNGLTLPAAGAASYNLVLHGLRPGRYALYVPQTFSSSRVLVNGVEMSRRGVYGLSAATTVSLHRPHEFQFSADGRDVALRIDVSTFHHRDNGLYASPIFGLAEPMTTWDAVEWIKTMLLVASLMLLVCYGLVVFLFRPQERASLYFALACVNMLPLAAVLGHDNLLHIAMPWLSFNGMLAAHYLTSATAVGLALAYVRALFPRETPRTAYWVFQGFNTVRVLAYAAIAVTGNSDLLSEVSQWSSILRTIGFLCMLAVVIFACVRRREGSFVFLFGLGSFIFCLIYSDIVFNAHLPPIFGHSLMPVGSVLLLFSQLLILAERWSTSIDASERSNTDLRRLLDVNISISSEMQLGALLNKIVTATTKLIHAERSSLFVHDERSGELVSMVAEGVDAREIRFPADRGLAGWCFTNGEVVNLADAYADPRFNREVDAATGYRTKSVLTVPVTTREGRRVGVMQALNHQDGAVFGEDDVERMSAFAAQAAIAIENATLFTEVASERNYNESILRSMSSGVITLDREAHVAKLNSAACAILGFTEEQASGAAANRLLSGPNAWILDEINGVNDSGHPKALLDADIRTALGDTISTNISIVPLLTDGEAAGVLILVEDITEGKRMQGAMRRFMTQKVVDQIMGREDELLFGAACQASVLFADIRNFTNLAERLGPRETVEMLNEIFTDLFEAVAGSDGVLDKFIGDAVMAVYGAPLPSGRDALNSVDSAVNMVGMIAAINARRQAKGLGVLGLGVGVATGEVVAGTIGSPKRMDYTVIGDSVNLASRLEAITKDYQVGIIVCEDTAAAVGEAYPMRELDTLRVRGRERPARIFQVVTPD